MEPVSPKLGAHDPTKIVIDELNADIDAIKDALTGTAHAVTEAAEDIKQELTDTMQQSLSRVRAMYDGENSLSNQISDSVMERGLLAGTAVGGSKVAYTATRDTAGIAAGAAIGTSRAFIGAAFQSGKALSDAAMKTGVGKAGSKYSDRAGNSAMGKAVSDNADMISKGLGLDKVSGSVSKFSSMMLTKKLSGDEDRLDVADAVDGIEQKAKALINTDNILGRLVFGRSGGNSSDDEAPDKRRRRRRSLDRIESALDYDVDQTELTPGGTRQRHTGIVENRGELVSRVMESTLYDVTGIENEDDSCWQYYPGEQLGRVSHTRTLWLPPWTIDAGEDVVQYHVVDARKHAIGDLRWRNEQN